ncbi:MULTISPECIES: heavy metal translocating P-type ATPase [unclassified Devosia]|jgi:Cu2+-exporting ATPase|uniref:heavy metal translocating P-type ATPase n=1 Tax=unclassified Devosia TaxID=196773 RepID=UPI000A7EC4A8|nr:MULTISPECIES: heavy metal translocating P-type ATPase [unclassified Devosia]MBN9364223.1 cadmium-translocating P-type ATPase [Devosia sp.]
MTDRREGPSSDEVRLASVDLGDGMRQSDFAVPSVHCGGCVRRIEKALGTLHGVEAARVNLSTRRLAVRWRAQGAVPPIVEALQQLGYPPNLREFADDIGDSELARLIKALAVAAFSSMNIMMLAGSVWSGADGTTRDILHWICAALTLPVLLYSGRIFYGPAWNAVRHGHTNMDVPISIGVLLAFALSLYDTINHGAHAYYDATATLIFFLLIGRTLDHVMRERARTAVRGLARLASRGALVLHDDGSREYLALADIVPGMRLLIAAGERIPVDAVVIAGHSDLDRSLVNGEAAPHPAEPGARLEAGTLNLSAPLTLQALAAERDSFLAQTVRLMEVVESGRGGFRRLADRVAEFYSPVVHLSAFASFAAWIAISGDIHHALTIAIAVLIITCPCALGLAVPMVQVVAARRLFERGIMVRDSGALEQLAAVDTVVFDKTGTLTLGQAQLANASCIELDLLSTAGALAACSRHPHAIAIAAAAPDANDAPRFDQVIELPGCGIEGTGGGATWRLGRSDWALAAPGEVAGTVLARNGQFVAAFSFTDLLRPHAREAIAALRRQGMEIEILSGDRPEVVSTLAEQLGIETISAGVRPDGKVERLAELARRGRKVLMVGDGLNDAPALAAAPVSMAPANAADVGRNAAGFVFLRDALTAVPETIAVARRAAGLVRQNLALAFLYNVIAVPLAVLGHVTPLVAAIAMSLSSVVVVANALRLNADRSAGLPGAIHVPAPQGAAR